MAKINYNGIELEEVTEPQIFDPPKLCVCSDDDGNVCEWYVSAILPQSSKRTYRIIANTKNGENAIARHCAILPEKPAPRMATNRELARWLAQGNGQVHTDSNGGRLDTAMLYDDKCDDTPVRDGLMARKWGDTELHEPTIDYLGIKEG